jgi:methylenetetrahydrofolate--tRNA-(uracil-5-)-methyltransferase
MTPAHRTEHLAELVCSNSLRGNALDQAPGLLKEEMRRMDSLIIQAADETRVPAGSALGVDRVLFAERVTQALAGESLVTIHRTEVTQIPGDGVAIVASGPLTSDALAAEVSAFVGAEYLYFYDALSPVVEAASLDPENTFRAGRYGKGGADYINCPFSREEYDAFFQALSSAERVPLREFEQPQYFEGCLPIEVLADRGPDTLRHGPMKPVGLVDPRTGRRPYAVLQLRQENLAASHYSLVGFQTQLKWGEQQRVFRLIPGLAHADFVRFGMMHRNTYVNAPVVLDATFEARKRRGLFVAGQITGVEGYIESAAAGLMAGIGAARRIQGLEPLPFPEDTAHGALGRHVSASDPRHFTPTNIAFGLLPPLPAPPRKRGERRLALTDRALASLALFRARLDEDFRTAAQ